MLDINVKDVSLVLEGGTFRTVFTMGILDAFLDEGIMMPAYQRGISRYYLCRILYFSAKREKYSDIKKIPS